MGQRDQRDALKESLKKSSFWKIKKKTSNSRFLIYSKFGFKVPPTSPCPHFKKLLHKITWKIADLFVTKVFEKFCGKITWKIADLQFKLQFKCNLNCNLK